MTAIRAIGTYLPERTVGNDELIERFGWDREFLEDKLGIHQRHIAADDEGAAAMGVAAAEDLFAKCPDLRREDVQVLIVCTQNPDYGLPHTSALVQDRLGLPRETACFDIGLGCSGFVYGLAVVRGLLETLGLDNALLVTSDPYSKVIDPADDDRRDYRAIYDVSGDASLIDTLVTRLAPGGEIVLAGFYEHSISFAFAPAFMREARLRIAAEWKPEDMREVRVLLASGALSLDHLITHRSDVTKAGAAYRTAFEDPQCLKMALDWRACA